MTPTPRMHQARPSAGVFATSLQNVLLAGPASVSPGSTHALIRGVSGRFGRTRRPRTAFVLSGGASLGALQVGMLRALYERGIAPDRLVGASAGALNAAFVASRPQTVETADELAAIWHGLRREDVFPVGLRVLVAGLTSRDDHLIPDDGLRQLAALSRTICRLVCAQAHWRSPTHLRTSLVPVGSSCSRYDVRCERRWRRDANDRLMESHR
jgi:Patatin-like phospholipase